MMLTPPCLYDSNDWRFLSIFEMSFGFGARMARKPSVPGRSFNKLGASMRARLISIRLPRMLLRSANFAPSEHSTLHTTVSLKRKSAPRFRFPDTLKLFGSF